MDDYLVELMHTVDKVRWGIERMRTCVALLGEEEFSELFSEDIADIETVVIGIVAEVNALVGYMLAEHENVE